MYIPLPASLHPVFAHFRGLAHGIENALSSLVNARVYGEPMSVLAVLEEIRVLVESDTDVVAARQQGRLLMVQLGFSTGEATVVATAISELARNMIAHARGGEIVLTPVEDDDRCGLIITARDEGEGIADIRRAMREGFSTTGSLGLGLPGVKRLMDEFEIASEVGRGTTVTVKKWMAER